MRELNFGRDFNHPLDNSLSNLINLNQLTLSVKFNQPLNNVLSNLSNLRELTFGYEFNQQVDIPHWIKKLNIDCNFQLIINYLPSSIVELEFGSDFNL